MTILTGFSMELVSTVSTTCRWQVKGNCLSPPSLSRSDTMLHSNSIVQQTWLRQSLVCTSYSIVLLQSSAG